MARSLLEGPPRPRSKQSIAGELGGKKTLELHGTTHFSRQAQQVGKKLFEEHGPEYFQKLSRLAVEATAAQRTREYYSNLGKRSQEKRRLAALAQMPHEAKKK